ncbi:MAG TPA: hypothetical protein PLX74_12805, partial [Chitinophagaceae bacterium]|nr:hypothetical protein [Chitinophagaceae bacterium]
DSNQVSFDKPEYAFRYVLAVVCSIDVCKVTERVYYEAAYPERNRFDDRLCCFCFFGYFQFSN